MDTILLEPNLQEALVLDAQQQARSLNDLVNEAVEQYLRDKQRKKLEREIEAFNKLYPRLAQVHLGQWVAIHNQELIDFDTNGEALYQRIRAEHGTISILIRQITATNSDEIGVHTWSKGKRT